jgi:subtilisin family serine protease
VSAALRLATATLFAGSSLLAVPLASAAIEAHTGRPTRGDRALVKVESGARLPEALRSGSRNLFGDWWRVPISAERSSTAELARLAAFGGIVKVEADVVHRLDLPATGAPAEAPLISNDPLFPRQWHHRAVQAETAWQRSTGDGVVVAVIDSGVTPGGPDGFCHPLAGEYDAVRDEAGPGEAGDLLGHGTFVASVVAECTGNGVGAAGLAPDARILAIRACTLNGECASSDVAAAIDWATTHGARVINLSLGMGCGDDDWPDCSTAIENEAIARAAAAGVSIVANAGNRAESHLGFPANHPEVIGVGGLDALLRKTTYSSWGAALSLTAPGGEPDADADGDGFEDQILQETLREVCGAGAGFDYCLWSGTSFAAPHVAAALALLLEEHPEASRAQLRRAIEESALDRGAAGFDAEYGHGALQAAAALQRLDEIVVEAPTCVPTATTLCLGDGRFALEVGWRDYAGRTGSGVALPLTDDSGLFWFFDAANLEMLVKVVDGCALNGHRWIFAAATTDVEYELIVTEVPTGASRPYRNELGTASPAFTDTSAFPCSAAPPG